MARKENISKKYQKRPTPQNESYFFEKGPSPLLPMAK
jgi:hypothetical protein